MAVLSKENDYYVGVGGVAAAHLIFCCVTHNLYA